MFAFIATFINFGYHSKAVSKKLGQKLILLSGLPGA